MRDENTAAIRTLAGRVKRGVEPTRGRLSVVVGEYSAWNGVAYWASEDDPHTLMCESWCAPRGATSKEASEQARRVYAEALAQ